jgi:glycosyltransferase involved in cell wall biosynthesis
MLPDLRTPSAILRAVRPPDGPRVTVIIGTWNRAQYVGEAIRSILEQTVRELELIVADDGSTDGTDAVVGQFDDPRLSYLPGPHVGISRNLNRALAQARAPYAAVLDSDDWSHPARLERQLAVLDARPEVAAVGHRLEEVDEHGNAFSPRTSFAAGDVNGVLMRFNPVPHSSVAYRRDAVLAVGGYDPSYTCTVDWDLWLRLADHHVIHTLDEVLGVRRHHGESISVARELDQVRAGLRTRIATARRRRSIRGITGLAPAMLSLMTPMPLKRYRRRVLGQAE